LKKKKCDGALQKLVFICPVLITADKILGNERKKKKEK